MTKPNQVKTATPRGGDHRVPVFAPGEVDAALGPDAATLTPLERFRRLMGRVIRADKPKPPDAPADDC